MKRTLSRIFLSLLVILVLSSTAGLLSCGLLETLPGPSQQPPEAPSSPPPSARPLTDSNWQIPVQAGSQSPILPSIASVAEQARPTVVAVHTETIQRDIFLQPVPQEGAGTGVIIDPSGIILTNNHVVEEASTVKVTFADGSTLEAVEIRQDPQTDLAIIKVEAQNLPTATIGDSTKLHVGDWVVAIGNALALEGGPTVTAGIVSYIGRTIETTGGTTLYDLIQTDAAINPGNSGGPLLNMSGEIVGINTAIAGTAQNIGFAISITPAATIVQSLINVGYVARPWLGVGIYTVTPAVASFYDLNTTEGVLILSVEPNSPAERAGITSRDVIVSLDGEKMATAEQLRLAVQAHRVGDTLTITYQRNNTTLASTITLGTSPAP